MLLGDVYYHGDAPAAGVTEPDYDKVWRKHMVGSESRDGAWGASKDLVAPTMTNKRGARRHRTATRARLPRTTAARSSTTPRSTTHTFSSA